MEKFSIDNDTAKDSVLCWPQLLKDRESDVSHLGNLALILCTIHVKSADFHSCSTERIRIADRDRISHRFFENMTS